MCWLVGEENFPLDIFVWVSTLSRLHWACRAYNQFYFHSLAAHISFTKNISCVALWRKFRKPKFCNFRQLRKREKISGKLNNRTYTDRWQTIRVSLLRHYRSRGASFHHLERILLESIVLCMVTFMCLEISFSFAWKEVESVKRRTLRKLKKDFHFVSPEVCESNLHNRVRLSKGFLCVHSVEDNIRKLEAKEKGMTSSLCLGLHSSPYRSPK